MSASDANWIRSGSEIGNERAGFTLLMVSISIHIGSADAARSLKETAFEVLLSGAQLGDSQRSCRELDDECDILTGSITRTLSSKCRQTAVGHQRVWRRHLAIAGEAAKSSIVIEFIFVVNVGELFKVELVAHDGADATKAFHELIAL